MFTRAGFSRRCHARIWARVSMIGGRGLVWGFLVHWPAVGEFAWGSSTRIVWPHRVRLHSEIYVDGARDLPASRLGERISP